MRSTVSCPGGVCARSAAPAKSEAVAATRPARVNMFFMALMEEWEGFLSGEFHPRRWQRSGRLVGIKSPVVPGKLKQHLRRGESSRKTIVQLFKPFDHAGYSDGVHVPEGATAKRRKPDPVDRADIAVARAA